MMRQSCCHANTWLAMMMILLATTILPSCHGLAFSLPKMPWDSTSSSSQPQTKLTPSSDTVAVIGASGNVGKLVALRLADSFKRVEGVVRTVRPELQEFFSNSKKNNIRLHQVDLLDYECTSELQSALEKANVVVICTGTTAFPTKAWSRTGDSDIASTVLQQLVSNNFNLQRALQALDDMGLNTPYNVDNKANEFIVETWNRVAKVPQKRIILLSSIGVTRRDGFPFTILNTCGVLDAKAAAEAVISSNNNGSKCPYTIIRPGQLFGGPYDNNYYLGTLFQLDKDEATQNVEFQVGDTAVGDTLRSTLAEVTAQVLESTSDACVNMDFAVINTKGSTPSIEVIQERLAELG